MDAQNVNDGLHTKCCTLFAEFMLFYNLLEEQLRKIYIIEDKKLTQDCIRKMSDEEFKELYTDYAKRNENPKCLQIL